MPHINYALDNTVETFVVYNHKVLLREHDKYRDKNGKPLLLSIGGHIEIDEDPNEAAIREVKEEVGLEIILFNPVQTYPFVQTPEEYDLIPPAFMKRQSISATHEHCTFYYFATALTNDILIPENEKKVKCYWFNNEELDNRKKDLSDRTYLYAKKALEVYKTD